MGDPGVLLGLGGTVDYEIAWDARAMGDLAAEFELTLADLSPHRPIREERDLLAVVLGHAREGIGGERFVADRNALLRFAGRFAHHVTLGGTNVRAAIALDALGVPSTVHLVSIDDDVRRLLPPSVSYISSATRDSTDPHVIVQFPAETTVRVGGAAVTAPRENRVILVNDPPNRNLVLAPELAERAARSSVVMVSGFNTMEDPDLLSDRLRSVRGALANVPTDATVYYEDAGFHREEFRAFVQDSLVDLVSVWSMNEDELAHYVGARVDLLDPGRLSEALRLLADLVPARTLVVHSRYWALAVGEDAQDYRGALVSGTTAAATRYRLGDGWGADDFAQTARQDVHPDGEATARLLETEWGERICAVPSWSVTPELPTTIGLGDTFAGGFIAGLPQVAALRR